MPKQVNVNSALAMDNKCKGVARDPFICQHWHENWTRSSWYTSTILYIEYTKQMIWLPLSFHHLRMCNVIHCNTILYIHTYATYREIIFCDVLPMPYAYHCLELCTILRHADKWYCKLWMCCPVLVHCWCSMSSMIARRFHIANACNHGNYYLMIINRSFRTTKCVIVMESHSQRPPSLK